MRAFVLDLERNALLRPVLAVFVDSPRNRLVQVRYGFDFVDRNRQKAVRNDGNPAWTSYPPLGALYLTKDWVQSDVRPDPRGSFDLRRQVLVHELMHVYDSSHHHSTSAAFRRAMVETLGLVNLTECQKLFRAFQSAGRSGYWDAWATLRRATKRMGLIGRPGSLPSTMICDAAPGSELWAVETFADFATHWVLDPIARSEYPPPARAWFEQEMPLGKGR